MAVGRGFGKPHCLPRIRQRALRLAGLVARAGEAGEDRGARIDGRE